MIKAVIMDFSGVVCQQGSLLESIVELCPRLDYNKAKEKYNLAKVSKISNDEYLSFFTKESMDWSSNQVTIHKGATDFLKNNKLPLYIASNHISKIIQKEIDILGVREYFDNIFISDKLRVAKPSEEFYQEVLKRIKLKANEVVFIDDQKRNLIPAKAMGMKTIWVNNMKVDPFGDNGDIVPDAEVYNLAELNSIISEFDKNEKTRIVNAGR